MRRLPKSATYGALAAGVVIFCVGLWIGVRYRQNVLFEQEVDRLGGSTMFTQPAWIQKLRQRSDFLDRFSQDHDELLEQLFGELTRLSLKTEEVDDLWLSRLAHFSEIKDLALDCPNATSNGLRILRNFKSLNSIELTGRAVDDLVLESLDNAPLVRLSLTNTNVSGTGLEHLRSWPAMYKLSLTDTPIDDDGLRNLVHTPNLDTLYLIRTQVSDAGLSSLSGLTKLTWLRLGGPLFTDAGLVVLNRLPAIRMLDLEQTNVTGSGFEKIRSLPELLTLSLYRSPIRDEELRHLRKFPNLGYLLLEGTPVSDAGMKHLAGLPNWLHLRLSRTQVTDLGINELLKAHDLLAIELRETRVTAEGIGRLRMRFPKAEIVHSSR